MQQHNHRNQCTFSKNRRALMDTQIACEQLWTFSYSNQIRHGTITGFKVYRGMEKSRFQNHSNFPLYRFCGMRRSFMCRQRQKVQDSLRVTLALSLSLSMCVCVCVTATLALSLSMCVCVCVTATLALSLSPCVCV